MHRSSLAAVNNKPSALSVLKCLKPWLPHLASISTLPWFPPWLTHALIDICAWLGPASEFPLIVVLPFGSIVSDYYQSL